jgi:hypothetical protein
MNDENQIDDDAKFDARLTLRLDAEMDGRADLDAADVVAQLRAVFHYLQLYATWGVRLPHTEVMLQSALGIDDLETANDYKFFQPMLGSNLALHNVSSEFLTEVFPQVVKLGTDLDSFAETAAGDRPELGKQRDNDGIFNLVLRSFDSPLPARRLEATSLLGTLRDMAEVNAKFADNLGKGPLKTYKTELENTNVDFLKPIRGFLQEDEKKFDTQLDDIKGVFEEDSSLTDEIDQLIAAFREKTDALGSTLDPVELNVNRQQSKVKLKVKGNIAAKETSQMILIAVAAGAGGLALGAGTTAAVVTFSSGGSASAAAIPLTVAGIGFAVSLGTAIPAAILASRISELETKLATLETKVQTALGARLTLNSATTMLENAIKWTDEAVACTAILSTEWATLHDELDTVHAQLEASLSGQAEGVPLDVTDEVRNQLAAAGAAWGALRPKTRALVSNPYITVLDGTVTWGAFSHALEEIEPASATDDTAAAT